MIVTTLTLTIIFTLTAALIIGTAASLVTRQNGSGEECSAESACGSGLKCVGFPALGECLEESELCACLPSAFATTFMECDTTEDCPAPLTCRETLDNANFRVCYPEEFAALPGFREAGTCVEASALRDVPHLVFKDHVLARVLCDEHGSCATPGHVVAWRGGGMMMKSYCEAVGCEEKILAVNSPKYEIGLRVRSRTKGLQYTAFAARFESAAEELALAAVVRVGL